MDHPGFVNLNMNMTNSSKGMSIGRNTMQGFAGLVSPPNHGSMEVNEKKRPKILV